MASTVPAGARESIKAANAAGSRSGYFDQEGLVFARVDGARFLTGDSGAHQWETQYTVVEAVTGNYVAGQRRNAFYEAGNGTNGKKKPFWGNVKAQLVAFTGLDSKELDEVGDDDFEALLDAITDTDVQHCKGFIVQIECTPNKDTGKVWPTFRFPEMADLKRLNAPETQLTITAGLRAARAA